MRLSSRTASALGLALACLLTLAAPQRAHAAKIPLGDGPATLNVGVLVQPWLQLSREGAPSGGVGPDLYLRRVRLIVSGNVTERISFFIQTDQPNLGKDNTWTGAPFFIQDAFASVKLTDANPLFIDAGMLLAPLVHQTLQGAATLHTLDYHSSLVRFPATEGRIWRDAGVQLRGLVGPLHFRVGVFNGIEGTAAKPATDSPPAAATPALNPDDLPRVVAHVRYNFLGSEDGFFFNGIYFADQPKLSVGVGADCQPRSVLSEGAARDDVNVGADVFFDYPLANDQELVAQASVFRYFQGRDAAPSGLGVFGEVGYRIGLIEPLVSAEYFNADVASTGFVTVRPGVNFWVLKHTFNVKAEVAVGQQQVPTSSTPTTSVVGTAQMQLFY